MDEKELNSEEELESEEREKEDDYEYFDPPAEFESPSCESLNSLPDVDDNLTPQQPKPEKRFNRKPGWAWKKPSTKVYPDTFSFFVNSYQPMIDYLDLKDAGYPVNKQDIHLPFLEERCLEKYSSTKPFKWYTNTDIDRYIAKGEKIRTQIRQNDAACASNVLRRTHTNWSMTRKYVQLVKNSFVKDPRKIGSVSDVFKPSVPPLRYSAPTPPLQKFLLIPLTREYNWPHRRMVDVSTAHQIDHELMMANRRKRMQQIDDQIGSSINHMTATVDLLNRPHSSSNIDVPITCADDLLGCHRSRREEEMDHMLEKVDDITNADSERNVIRRMYSNELSRVQNERLSRKPAKSRVIYAENPIETDLSFLRTRASPMIVDLDAPRYRRPKEDTVSDVQDRVYQRAKEMTGTTSEMRRINDRSKYLNIMGPRTTLDIVPIGYTKTADNIEHMARDFATAGRTIKRREAEDELDDVNDLILNANINMLRKTYSAQPLRSNKPMEPVPSDSLRVREAQSRASTRNTLLHGY